MSKPTYYPGDMVLIRSNEGEGLSGQQEGQIGVIVRNLNAELRRLKGSKVTSAYYRVYIPSLHGERSVKGHFLELIERNPNIEDAERRRQSYLAEVKEREQEMLEEPPEELFGDLGEAVDWYKAHRRNLE